jgi:hypothetical protein
MEMDVTGPVAAPWRRRGRWLMVALLLLVGGLWLSAGSRGRPAEMAGLWRHSRVASVKKVLPDLLLRADGSGEFVHAKGGTPITWWADGPLVVMQPDTRSAIEWLEFTLGEALARLRGTGWRRPQVRLYVPSLTPEQMVFFRVVSVDTTPDPSTPEEALTRVKK